MESWKRTPKLIGLWFIEVYAFVIPAAYRLLMNAALTAYRIRKNVHDALGYDLSAGIAINAWTAKVASVMSKPNGQVVVLSGGTRSFMGEKDVAELPGEKRNKIQNVTIDLAQ